MYILYNQKMCHCFTSTFHDIGDFVRKFADILQSAQFPTESSQKDFHKLPQFWKKVKNSTCANRQGKVKIFYSKASQDQLWKAGDLLNSPFGI